MWRFLPFLLLLAACSGSTPTPPPPPPGGGLITVSMNPNRWVFQYSPNMPFNPAAHPQGWEFKFPSQDGVHYLVTGVSGRISNNVWTAVRIEKTGDVQFVESDPCPPSPQNPAMRLYFQRRGDDLSAAKQFYRWWSVERFLLSTETASGMSVGVQPSNWTSVLGKSGDSSPEATAGFMAAAADLQVIGMTFGGCFAGHGVYVTGGSATLVASGFSVN